jgi:hypothetical protein
MNNIIFPIHEYHLLALKEPNCEIVCFVLLGTSEMDVLFGYE